MSTSPKYAGRVRELLTSIYQPKLSSLEYNGLCIRAKEIVEIEEAKNKAEGEVIDRRIAKLPYPVSFTPRGRAELSRVVDEFEQKLKKRSQKISKMAGRDNFTDDDVTIAVASLIYGLKIKGIWF